jgi:hypothetical protein
MLRIGNSCDVYLIYCLHRIYLQSRLGTLGRTLGFYLLIGLWHIRKGQDKHQCHERDANPRSSRPAPQTVSALIFCTVSFELNADIRRMVDREPDSQYFYVCCVY